MQKFQKLPPVRMVKAIDAFRNLLLKLHRRLFPGNVVLYEHLQAFWLLPALYVAAKLDIAGLIENEPLSPDEIAKRLNLHPSSTARFMRALSGQGIFTLRRDGRYAVTKVSRALLERPGSLRYTILHHLGAVNWNLMSNLEYAVRTGHDAFTDKFGMSVYEYLAQNKAEYELFDKSMSNLSDLGLAPVLNAYDFGKHKVIADIGGGEGFLLSNILFNFNVQQGVLFDQSGGPEPFKGLSVPDHIKERITRVEGSFFEEIPSGADLYILKNVIHNWDDIQAVAILANIGKVMKRDTAVMIIEMVVPDGNQMSLSKLLDIQMLVTTKGGKERTAAEFSAIVSDAGLSITRIIPTIAPVCLIVAHLR